MPTVKELQDRRAPLGKDIRRMADTLNATKPDFTAEEKGAWERMNRDFNDLSREIEQAEHAETRAANKAEWADHYARGGQKPGAEDTVPRAERKKSVSAEDSEELRAVAVQAWCRKQHGLDLTKRHVDACKRTGLNPNHRTLAIDLPRRPGTVETRSAQSATTGNLGGYTVPVGFVANLEKAMKDYSGPRQVADVLRTDSGNSLPWPTTNDTSNVGELIAENATVGQQEVPFGFTTFGAYKFSSKMVLVPTELLDDSAFVLNDELSLLLGERIGRAQEAYFTTGTGSSQPQGVVTGATLGVTTVGATSFTGDDIISLIHSVDPAYRRDPSFRLMFHDNILAAIRKLKDSQNRYLFEEGQNGAPDKVKGARYVINQNMASAITTGQKTMLAGAFRKFKIRDVKQVRVKRLDERYADADQVGFIAFMRSDSKLLDAGTHPIKYLQQA